jgi:hypothetical protein
MTTYNSTDAGVWLLISVVVFWLLIYSAVRAAVGHALDRVKPRLVAETETTDLGVAFVLRNIGTASAFDVSVAWDGNQTGDVLARAPLLGIDRRLEWTIAAGPVANETASVRRIKVEWATGMESPANRHSRVLAVLVPSRIGPIAH